MNLLLILAVASVGAIITLCVYALYTGDRRADEWADSVYDAEMDKRDVYNSLRERAKQ